MDVWKNFTNYCQLILLVTVSFGAMLNASENHQGLEHPVVETVKGSVRGNRIGTVDVFWGIPYAKSPTGELRFAHPVPVDAWTHVHDATAMPKTCHQINSSSSYTLITPTSEDCLYLNVFAPKSSTATTPTTSLTPVMVFFHGGALIRGSSALEIFNATTIAAVNDVIVVTFNYRIGAFGFLYSASKSAPGNAAAYDQLMALEWVRDNVARFGGDPDSVTLFGESAGSASVGYLAISPLAKHLFKRVILSSGSPLANRLFVTRDSAFNTVIELARATSSCNDSSWTEATGNSSPEERARLAVQCLKTISERELDAAQDKARAKYGFVVDGKLLPDLPDRLLVNVVAKNISVMLGRMKDEGNFFLPRNYPTMVSGSHDASLTSSQLDEIIKQEASANSLNSVQEIFVAHQYKDWQDLDSGSKNVEMAGLLVGDSFLNCPISKFGTELSALGVDVKMYSFSHRSSFPRGRPRWRKVTHGDDMPFIFGRPLLHNNTYTKAEVELSLRVMKHFVTFAKTGNPSFDGFHWPNCNGRKLEMVKLDTKTLRVIKDARANACALWNIVLPSLENIASCAKNETNE